MSFKVVYIEDNVDNIEIVTSILGRHNYEVEVATDGDMGVEVVKEYQPDIIICDYHLPGLNGPEVVQTIRDIPEFTDTPIIMLTADIYSRANSIKAGVDVYLNKPIRRKQLLSAMEDVIAKMK